MSFVVLSVDIFRKNIKDCRSIGNYIFAVFVTFCYFKTKENKILSDLQHAKGVKYKILQENIPFINVYLHFSHVLQSFRFVEAILIITPIPVIT